MVGTMIVAAAAGTTAAGVAASFALTAAAFAVNFAVSMIVTRVFGQNQQSPQDSGTREQVPPSNINAIPIVYGNAYLGGTFVDAVLNTQQTYMYYVLAVSSISPNGQFTFNTSEMYYGDRLITFTGGYIVSSLTDEAGNVDSNINGNLSIFLYTSNQSGTITPVNSSYMPWDGNVMGTTDIAADQRWPVTNRQMNGLAFAIVRLRYNQDAGTTTLSPITFNVSQYLNGTGAAKPGDVWYDYITNTAYGGAVNSDFVDAASVTALNVYSDQVITFQTYTGFPSTQPRYRINGVIDAGQTVLSNLDKIMTCCDSWMAYNAASGKWSIVINKAESSAYSFDDDNIIGEIRVSATDITQSINQVEAKFPNKAARDQPDFVNLATPFILRYPNEPDNKYSVNYDLVNDSVQAQYLANRILEQAREDLIVSFSTTYYGIQVDAGAVVSVTNSDYGWSNKLFRVVKVNEASLPDGSLGARLEMSEYSAAVYDDFNITQYAPVPNSGIPSVGYFSSLFAPTVTGYATATIPYFNVTVTIPSTGRITFIDLYYTTAAIPTPSDWKLLTSANTSDSQPYTNGSSFTFLNQILPSGTYYFGYIVGSQISQSKISAQSAAFIWNPIGMSGPFVDISGVTSFSKTSTNIYTPATATLNAVIENIISPTYTWMITGATPTSSTLSSITITPNAAATSITAQLTVNGTNLDSPIVKSLTMAIINQVNKYDTAYLYQWSTVTPGNPSGSSTFTWATGANSSYTGGNGWTTTPGANPGTPLIKLYVASKQVTDIATATTTTVSWASGYSIIDSSQNGAAGVQSATPTVYQWALSIPSISGTSIYTWSNSSFTPNPSGWSNGISTAPSAGYTLWAAKVTLTESATITTSTINWTTASITAAGYSGNTGATGASARIMYARIASNPTPIAGTVTVTGDNRPTGAQASAIWGASFNVTWYASDPDPASNNSLYQADGTYNGTNTVWATPYISSLKVGQLSAISANAGTLTAGTITAGMIQSGTTGTYNGGTWTMGNTGVVLNGFSSVQAVKTTTNSRYGILVFQETASSNTAGAIGASTISNGAFAYVGLASYSTSYDSFYTSSGINSFTASYTGRYNRSIGTSGNNDLTPVNLSLLSTSDNAGYFAYYGNTATQRVAEAYLANTSTVSAGVFRRYDTTGATLVNEIYLNNSSYSAQSTTGAIYSAGGYLPFTGTHDGLIEETEAIVVGDIVVDYQVEAILDPSNIVMLYKKSSIANQKGVIGVCIKVFDIPPDDWNEYETTQEYNPITGAPIPDPTPIPNPMYYPIPAGQKVIHINALGEGTINVTSEGGNIEIGDLIVTSSTPGKGMKQADDVVRSTTVAKARQAITFSSPSEIKQVACIYLGG